MFGDKKVLRGDLTAAWLENLTSEMEEISALANTDVKARLDIPEIGLVEIFAYSEYTAPKGVLEHSAQVSVSNQDSMNIRDFICSYNIPQ